MASLQSAAGAPEHALGETQQGRASAVRIPGPFDERVRVGIVELLQSPYQPFSETQPLTVRQQQQAGGALEDARCDCILLAGVVHTRQVINGRRQLVSQVG